MRNAFARLALLVGVSTSGLFGSVVARAQEAGAPRAQPAQPEAQSAPVDPQPLGAGASASRSSPAPAARAAGPKPFSTVAKIAAEIAAPPGAPFKIDFVADGAVLTLGAGFSILSDLIIGTGEITPQQPQDPERLLGVDRRAVNQRFDPQASLISNVGIFAAIGFAIADPISTGLRHGAREGLVDAMMYAETIALAASVTNLAKIAFRRPRPEAYKEQAALYEKYGKENAPDISDTNSALSFFSGHSATTAAITATATYLAAKRVDTKRMLLVATLGAMTTGLVGYGRVRSGKHFPTDVAAGTMAGIGIGVLVPHFHLATPNEGPPKRVAPKRVVPRAFLTPRVFADGPARGGELGLSGFF